ncbi:dTDP-4-dehydrorhamnose 3,5-epimerase [Metabacillus elymi]|uniref:dTDP-4-dehydrorhamnose 3,5-epimerase n=1 Tax=Metabacillus elymi TaxID=2745198 RepID=A0ABX6S395_9BACI|nr:dTDP-4-dehydrorhamnose 3,5-epimerase [Metabacillus sp. KUDC1714]QNF28474.1 dTDP-4-dehydrorhamnose 3,5-epimerase [Metabacillus sp. KUDC1714]
MNFNIKKTKLPGCFEIIPDKFEDKRGTLIKVFHKDIFLEKHLEVEFAEEYYSISDKDVLRGLHFQLPPKDQVKLVSCISGEVFDVVVDLRLGSPTYGVFETFHLSAKKASMVYIPKGLAHGFYVCKEPAIMLCKTSTVFSPEYDHGIHWSSLDIPWPNKTPKISEKDSKLPIFNQFNSPFHFTEEVL